MNVLIVKTSSMGDLIHTLPAVTDARRAIPDIQFDWVAEESFMEIPGWHPGVDKVIPIALRRWRKNWIQSVSEGELSKVLRNLRSRQYDLIIDAQGLIKSALITRLARGVRFGMDWHSCREPLASFGYQYRISVTRRLHAIERVRQLFARALEYEYDISQLDYGLERNDFSSGIVNEANYLVFLHATSWKSKLWPVEDWVRVAEFVNEQGYKIVLPWGSPEEKMRAVEIAGKVDKAMVLPQLNLQEIAAILSKARAIVGLDTGLAHLGAALDIPGITLYLATSPALTGTLGNQQICLSQHEDNDLENRVKFSGTVYSKRITPEIVCQSLKKWL